MKRAAHYGKYHALYKQINRSININIHAELFVSERKTILQYHLRQVSSFVGKHKSHHDRKALAWVEVTIKFRSLFVLSLSL